MTIAFGMVLLMTPALAWGEERRGPFRDHRGSSLSAGETIEGDHFAFGPLVTISGTINGDAYIFGGQVIIDGKINGDLLIARGRVSVSGNIAQDVRAAGGQIPITGMVGRNLTVAGGSVEIARSGSIGGSVVACGGNIHLAAPVKGSAKIAAGSLIVSNRLGGRIDAAVGTLRITSNARVAGDVNYYSRREAEVETGARLEGELVRNPPPRLMRPSPEKIFIFFTGLGIFILLTGFVSTLILGLLSLRFLPSYHQAVANILKQRPGASLGLGFVTAIVVPVVCALLFSIVVTIPIALILTAAFAILLFWGRIFVISRLGEAIMGPKNLGLSCSAWCSITSSRSFRLSGGSSSHSWFFPASARKQVYREARARELLWRRPDGRSLISLIRD